MNRPRPQTQKSLSTPPPSAYPIWSYPPATMSNPSLGQHSKYPLGLGHPRSQQHRHHSALHPRRPMEYPNYSPNHASSSTALSSEGASASSTPKGALKVFSSVKRSFSMNTTKKSGPSFSTTTAEETAAAQIRFSDSDASRPPPTVQQIAAGLVTGLRTSSRPRAPPPSRSSLKKSTTSSTSTSSSTSLASTSLMSTRTGSTTTAATSVASSRRRFSLKDALFGRSAPIAPITTTRKAVRFHVGSPNTEPNPLPL
ncbi:unnamed protein product [Rhizoctonia solani]|uniref:Uncharacterized protein n=1 Tax=Rhizoctonia solani TaxID=456999 RepID=A0A8H3AP56_9AGAM|nr:unnamed protein product [Rhizoctonia solani]